MADPLDEIVNLYASLPVISALRACEKSKITNEKIFLDNKIEEILGNLTYFFTFESVLHEKFKENRSNRKQSKSLQDYQA